MPLVASRSRDYLPRPRNSWSVRSGNWQAQGLVGWWQLWDDLPARIQDFSPFQRTGTLTGAAAYTPDPFGARALVFDAVSNYVGCGDTTYGDALTVTAWVKARVNKAVNNVAIKRNTTGTVTAGTNEWLIQLDASGIVGVTGFNAAQATIFDFSGSRACPLGVWSHVGMTIPGNGGTVWTYFNGIRDTSASQTGVLFHSTNEIQIGARSSNNNARYFDGAICGVRLYNRALSPAEMWGLFDPKTRLDLFYQLRPYPYQYPGPSGVATTFTKLVGGGGLAGVGGSIVGPGGLVG